jgi:serine/threonine-protein kinase
LLGLAGPAQVQARQTQPVAQRGPAIAPRFAPIALTTERPAQRDPWLTPRTQRQLGTMSLLPAVALFGAVFAGRVLLAVGGEPALHPAPITTAPATPAHVEPAPQFQAPEAAPTAPKLADVPLAPAAAKPVGRVARAAAPRRIEQFASPTAVETSASAPVGEGVLRINSRPWAEIFVDGTPVGNTPQTNLRLPAGAHTVELLNRPMSMNKTLHVVIQPGQTETRVVNLIE